MGSILGGIQHFLVIIFTAVTVILPFHKPPVHPIPSPNPVIQAKQEATPSATPEKVLGVNRVMNTPIPSNSGQSLQNTKSNQTAQPVVIHDGSRTGNIIKYHELCTGQDISVYENELLEKKGVDGKTYDMTQADWDCYNRANSQPQQSQQQLPPVSIPQTPQAQTPGVSVEAICKGYVNETTAALRAIVGSQSDWTGSYYEYAFANMYNYCLAHGGNMNGYQIPKPPPTNNNVSPVTQDCSIINNTVANIKANYQPSIDAQIRATTSSLGARGLLPSSPEGQQAISQSLQPIYADMNYQISLVCLRAGSCSCP